MEMHEIVGKINIVSIPYHYGIGKDSYIYFIDFHLDYRQLKFVSIYQSIFSSILLVRIWNMFEVTVIANIKNLFVRKQIGWFNDS